MRILLTGTSDAHPSVAHEHPGDRAGPGMVGITEALRGWLL